ncbi:uncharacterized protein BP01DRAFT_188226 [Aspergillus saccharolyticus JOP 1030-1]|uniref:Uncharacterized protein n=1 Tax=Aspergillus saccharolyticus JOP 1030-1 TaxID=1450539 RepID=A0A318ZBX3_9EURO|nr:hypothetical protein BP01DRAFT_188226 [Aspergillus saccharolyticus JOP 1030-1]PYH40980.1 hypothetical protein BP01DRAFT_188226 [Aspergillus saccharolyticus JOP 1030-1]
MSNRLTTSKVFETQSLNTPHASDICEISLIKITNVLVVISSSLVLPQIEGHDYLSLHTYAFYIHHQGWGRRSCLIWERGYIGGIFLSVLFMPSS